MIFYQKSYKNYVSEIDKCLAKFDHTHSPSATQTAEINKYKVVYQKRDNAIKHKKEKDIWDFGE